MSSIGFIALGLLLFVRSSLTQTSVEPTSGSDAVSVETETTSQNSSSNPDFTSSLRPTSPDTVADLSNTTSTDAATVLSVAPTTEPEPVDASAETEAATLGVTSENPSSASNVQEVSDSSPGDTSVVPTANNPVTIHPTDPTVGLCTCDLHSSTCDVDCCCDADCPAGVKSDAFATCLDVVASHNARQQLALPFCVTEGVVFRTNDLPYKTEITNDGLFCIKDWNYEEEKYYPQRDPFSTSSDVNAAIEAQSKGRDSFRNLLFSTSSIFWATSKDVLDLSLEDAIKASKYKTDQPILTLVNATQCATFNLPRSSLTSKCSDAAPSLFLRDYEGRCVRKAVLAKECKTGGIFHPSIYYEDRNFLPGRVIKKKSKNYDVTSCAKPADSAVDPPQKVISATAKNPCDTSFDAGQRKCVDSIKGLAYTFVVSPTGWIDKVEVDFECGNVTAGSDGLIELEMRHGVKFIIGETKESFPRSGNPGYIAGKPVLAGLFNSSGSSADGSVATGNILISADPTSWLTVPRPGYTGTCDARHPVAFNKNFAQLCRVTPSVPTCDALQKAARGAALGVIAVDRVGVFGNADPGVLGDWIPIREETVASSFSSSGACEKVVLSVAVSVLYADVGSVFDPQPKILGVRRQLFTGSAEPTSSFFLSSSIAFYDVTQDAENLYNPAPVVSATVPADFFYPLLRGGGGKPESFHFWLLVTIASFVLRIL